MSLYSLITDTSHCNIYFIAGRGLFIMFPKDYDKLDLTHKLIYIYIYIYIY